MAFCDRCTRYFKSNHALWQHEDNSSVHNICRKCNVDFPTYAQLIRHFTRAKSHNYCGGCEEDFDSYSELISHYEDEHYYCTSCNELFDSQSDEDDHNEEAHWYCRSCKRLFQSGSNLNSHLRSSIHQPLAHTCPGHKCNKSFVSRAARVLHWKYGTCPSGVTRAGVDRAAAKLDRHGVITNPGRLLTYAESPVMQMWATERAWNGDKYECFLCHKGFRTLNALNSHLQSPVHTDKAYHCLHAWQGCGKEFGTLSALCQHVESEQCGVHRFTNQLHNVIDSVSNNMKRLTL